MKLYEKDNTGISTPPLLSLAEFVSLRLTRHLYSLLPILIMLDGKEKIVNFSLSLLFPSTCPSCNVNSDHYEFSPFCSKCWKEMKQGSKGSRCEICGLALPPDYSLTCISCIKERPHYRKIYIFNDYEGTLKTAINLIKFQKRRRLHKPLGQLLSSMKLPDADAIVPVPLGRERLVQRGFNQSYLIGAILSKELGVDINPELLLKSRDTAPQSLLSRKKRLKNLKGAFSTLHPKEGKIPKRVLLVDDVMTTGATMNECARTLIRAGVRDVYGVVLARARED